MIIDVAIAERLNEVCVRIDAVEHLPVGRRLVDTEEAHAELTEYLGGPIDALAPIADRRFNMIGPEKYRVGRYNKSTFPAFYLARNLQSAQAETLHYNSEKLKGLAEISRPLHFGVTEWRVTAPAESLLPAAAFEPRLTHDNWCFCQKVGADVRNRADAVVAPSARLNDGVNVAVFKRDTVVCQNLRDGSLRVDLDRSGNVVFLD